LHIQRLWRISGIAAKTRFEKGGITMAKTLQVIVLICACITTCNTYAVRFGPPVPVQIDAPSTALGPSLTPDELTIFFGMKDEYGDSDLYYSTRLDKSSPFGSPVPLSSLNTVLYEHTPEISYDGLTLYYSRYVSEQSDIWMASRSSHHEEFGNPQPVWELNTDYLEGGPNLSIDGLSIFFCSRRPGGSGLHDLYNAKRPDTDSPFGIPVNLVEINTAWGEVGPSISTDQLILYYTLRPDPSGVSDSLWAAVRPDLNSPFGTPFELVELNMAGQRTWSSHISYDGRTIYFNSTRPGSLPGDLWMAQVIPEPFTSGIVLTVVGLVLMLRGKRIEKSPA
jgi:Tol biopolymer transport system component